MCGRYALIKDSELAQRYDKPIIGGYAVNPRYNVAASQHAPVITSGGIEVMRWGLLPPWAKDIKVGFSMINARAEDLLERPAYRGLISAHRCLVPASGFYEWRDTPSGKRPYYFFAPDEPLLSFAGLWTERLDAEGQTLKSFTIITTKPNKLVARIHDRMPVILDRGEENIWVDESITSPSDVLQLLDSFPAEQMDMYSVGLEVGNTRNDSPELIKRTVDPAY